MRDIVVGLKVIGVGGHSGAGRRGVVIESNPDQVFVLLEGQNCPVIISPQSFDSWFLKIEGIEEEPLPLRPEFQEKGVRFVGRIFGIKIAISPEGEIRLYAPARMKDEIIWEMEFSEQVYGLGVG